MCVCTHVYLRTGMKKKPIRTAEAPAGKKEGKLITDSRSWLSGRTQRLCAAWSWSSHTYKVCIWVWVMPQLKWVTVTKEPILLLFLDKPTLSRIVLSSTCFRLTEPSDKEKIHYWDHRLLTAGIHAGYKANPLNCLPHTQGWSVVENWPPHDTGSVCMNNTWNVLNYEIRKESSAKRYFKFTEWREQKREIPALDCPLVVTKNKWSSTGSGNQSLN